jgi:class 3 adenylate cyclase/tetratricopeptide (TPR) repeat protein/TolB-like protein
MSERPDGSVRRLSAIWFADIVGYTRLSSTDENTALLLVTVLQQLAREQVAAHAGRIVKFIGDAVLADFTSSDAALRAALALRDRFAEASAAAGAPSKLRIGVHVGDVLSTPDGDVYGDGVNLASRVQGAADPGQVCVTQDVWHQLRQRRDFRFESIGERKLKGLDAVWLFDAGMASAEEPAPAPPPYVPPPSVRYARIVRLALVYAVSSLILLQLTGLLSNRFDLGGWVTPAGLALLLIGFVVMIATGWVQTRSPWQRRVDEPKDPWKVDVEDLATAVKRKRFPTLTWGRALLGGALAFGLLFGSAGAYVLIKGGRFPGFAPRRAAAETGVGLAILPFDATGVDSSLWENGMTDLIAVDLNGAGVNVIDPGSVDSRWRRFGQGVDSAAAVRLGHQIGARYVVAGTTQMLADSLIVEAKVYDTETGELLATTSVAGHPARLPQLVDQLAGAILEGSGILPSADMDALNLSRLATGEIRAIRAYLEGVREFRRTSWSDAQDWFREAIEADSTFAQAQYRMSLSASLATNPHTLRDDSHMEQAVRYASGLPFREELLVRGYDRLSGGDHRRAIELLDSLTKLYPDEVEGWFLLGEAHYHLDPTDGRFRGALEEALRLDPAFGPAYGHLLEDASARKDLAEYQRLASGFLALDPGSPLQMTLDNILQHGSVPFEPTPAGEASTPTDDRARTEYASARRAADAARAVAADSGATSSLVSFARGDSLRVVAAAEASAGRYAAAVQRMEEAEMAYEHALSDRVLEVRIDSVLASVDALRRSTPLTPDQAAEVQGLSREATDAEAAGRYPDALRLARRVAALIRSAATSAAARADAQPATRTDAPPAQGPPPAAVSQPSLSASTDQIAAQVVEELRRALESQDLGAIRAVWTSLTADQANVIQQGFPIMQDPRVTIETLGVSSSGERITVRVRMTYEFFNTTTRRDERSADTERTLELGQRNGRWVVVSNGS